ncbi:MAG: YegP family protein [Clostridia bacterium]|nr:YegP family protein [Clostridia bacterium]
MGKFVISATKTGFKFNLKAGNGETIATSEVYTTLAACENGVASVQKNAPVANVEDQTVEGFATEKCPKFEIYTDKAGEFRFRLKATNGQIIAVSEGYKAIAGCKNGVESVKKNAADGTVEKNLEA